MIRHAGARSGALALQANTALKMPEALNWEREGGDWPMRDSSRFVQAGGLRWHVQITGSGPALLLVHGTGSSAHSWRRLVPLVSDHYTVVVPDLPGHAFTQAPARAEGFTLPAMADALAALIAALGLKPALVMGHSAGAAIALRAVLDGGLAADAVVSLNGALLPFGGAAGTVFAPLAKALVSIPWVPRLMAWRAESRTAVADLLRDTGSNLRADDVDLYARLFRNEGHVASTLAMMANWDLNPLVRDLPGLAVPLVLVAADNDKAISPADSERIMTRVKGATRIRLPGLGHLAHEERPDLIPPLLETAERLSQPHSFIAPRAVR